MALIDTLKSLTAPVAPEEEEKQPIQQPASWVSDLINKHTQDGDRLKRSPVGFQFQRDPFDPSSYYKDIGTLRDISTAATQVSAQEAYNREAARRQNEYNQTQSASQGAMAGVDPNYTYNNTGKSKKYGLGGVSSNTAKAADFWGNRYGIKTIGGRGPGSVPGSDHPKGRALDFMINNVKGGKARGTALANDIIKNYKSWNVKYVIWYHYIWFPGRGWHKYSGPSPHTDHVHVSFNK